MSSDYETLKEIVDTRFSSVEDQMSRIGDAVERLLESNIQQANDAGRVQEFMSFITVQMSNYGKRLDRQEQKLGAHIERTGGDRVISDMVVGMIKALLTASIGGAIAAVYFLIQSGYIPT